MKEEQPGLLVQHMTVERGDVDAVRAQRLDDRVHFVIGEDEITGNSRLAATGRLEVDAYRCAQRGGRSHLHSALGHGVAARHIELIDTPVRVALDPDDLIELSRVEIDRGRSSSWRGR